MSASRYLIGLDLGTTNCAVAYVDATEPLRGGRPTVHRFAIPQIVQPGEVATRETLPSFLYFPTEQERQAGRLETTAHAAAATPRPGAPFGVAGTYARDHRRRGPHCGRRVSGTGWPAGSRAGRRFRRIPARCRHCAQRAFAYWFLRRARRGTVHISISEPGVCAGVDSSRSSATMQSVVKIKPAIEAAFCSAERVTLHGSSTPIATMSPNTHVSAL